MSLPDPIVEPRPFSLESEMVRRVRTFDWASTPLGPMERWPRSLRTAVDFVLHSPAPLTLLWGHAGIMIYNDGYAVLAGERHPQILGTPVSEAFPEIADFNTEILAALLRGETRTFYDQHLTLDRAGDGVLRDAWFNLHYGPVLDDGVPAGGLAFLAETTERVLAEHGRGASEEALRKVSERMQLALNAGAVIGLWEWNVAADRVTGDALFARAFGLAADEADAGIPLSLAIDSIHPDDRTAVADVIKDTMARGGAYRSEYRVRNTDGVYRWIEANGRCELDAQERPIRFPGVLIDIHDRKLAEFALRDSQARDRFLLALGDRIRPLQHARGMVQTASEMLGRFLSAGRVGYAAVLRDAVLVEADWTDGAMTSLAGQHRLGDYGAEVIAELEAGRSVRIDDVTIDPRTKAIATFNAIGVGSTLSVPVMHDRRFVAAVYVHCAEPRHWSEADESLIAEVGQRLHAALDRARAEAALRGSETRFRTMTEAMPGFAWTTDASGRADYASPGWYDYSGASPEEGLRGLRGKFVHPEDAQRMADEWRAAVDEQREYSSEIRLRRRDGVYRWHIARALPVEDTSGVVARWVGTCNDIQENITAADVLTRSREDLERRVADSTRDRNTIWKTIPDLLCVFDLEGRITSTNPAWISILGRTEDEVASMPISELEHPDDRENAQQERARILARGTILRTEHRLRHKDGSYRVIAWTAAPLDNRIYAVGRDVTAERAQAEALRSTEDALRQAQKMEAVGQLTGGIAHDFNNLLTGIIGSLDLLRRRSATGRTADNDRFIGAAITSANRAASLTQRLLAFSRRQSLDLKPVDLNRLVSSTEDLLQRTLGEQITLRLDLNPDVGFVDGDPNQIETALLNLVINARDAMPEGGTLTIGTAWVSLTAAAAESGELAPGDYVVLRVDDTGTGMSPATIARAFDPFFTTKPIGQGTGLGLSMVYGYARQSRGGVRIESTLGIGTSIQLYLPSRAEGAEAGGDDAQGEQRHAGTGETVLVVEDDATVRLTIVEVLRELGYIAIEAHDGKMATPILQSNQRIDLLLTDVGLPGLNGRQVADIGRQHRPGLKVLFVTGYAEKASDRASFLDPGMELMTKPFALDELAFKVRDIIGQP